MLTKYSIFPSTATHVTMMANDLWAEAKCPFKAEMMRSSHMICSLSFLVWSLSKPRREHTHKRRSLCGIHLWGAVWGRASCYPAWGMSLSDQPTRTYCIAQGTLLNIVQQPKWEKIWKRIDTCVCVTESLCCTPETNTTLLINYTPI